MDAPLGLVIDDEPDLREIWREVLEQRAFQVAEADNGRAALAQLEHHRVRFVICDINMPVMNGIEFLKVARPKYPELPIFMVTGGSPYSEAEVLKFGATGIFGKSQDEFQKLVATIEEMV